MIKNTCLNPLIQNICGFNNILINIFNLSMHPQTYFLAIIDLEFIIKINNIDL